MKDVIMLKKISKLPDDPAPLTSPQFRGTPTAPDIDISDESDKIANTKFVTTRVDRDLRIYVTKLDDIEKKISVFDRIDIDGMTEDIKNTVTKDLSNDLLGKLTNNAIKIAYADLEMKQNGSLKIIDDLLNALETLSDVQKEAMAQYKSDLNQRRSQLIVYYNDMIKVYNDCINGNAEYGTFNTKFNTWYDYITGIDVYCQYVVRKLNAYLIGLKANNTQEDIFNYLTNNGQAQGLYLVEDNNGVKQLYINGQYMQLKGCKVKDVGGNTTFAIGADGSVTIDAVSLTVTGRSINTLVTDAMADSDVIQKAVNVATEDIVNNLNDLKKKSNELGTRIDNAPSVVRNAIKDDIITESEQKALANLFIDITARHNAVLAEIDATINIPNIVAADKGKLQQLRTAVVNSYNTMNTSYSETQKPKPTVESFTNFNTKLKAWNSSVGEARAYCNTAQANIIEISQAQTLRREQIFNILTNNGQDQGIYMLEDELYINGEYVVAGDFRANNSFTTVNVYANNIYSDLVCSQQNESIKLYIDYDNGDDTSVFRDGSTYKTLQALMDDIPNMVVRKVIIDLKTDVHGNVAIQHKHGGEIIVNMKGHNIFGAIRYTYGTSELKIYGMDENTKIANRNDRPVISPYNLYAYGTGGVAGTIYCTNIHKMYIRDVNVYSKLASDPVYTNGGYSFISTYRSLIEVDNCGITNTEQGFYINGASVIANSCNGLARQNGFYLCIGGSLFRTGLSTVGGMNNDVKIRENEKSNTYYLQGNSYYSFNANSNLLKDSNTANLLVQSTKIRAVSSVSCSRLRTNLSDIEWFNDNVVYCGFDTDKKRILEGAWFFGDKINNFYNKIKIKSGSMTITKVSASDGNLNKELTIYLHAIKAKDPYEFKQTADGNYAEIPDNGYLGFVTCPPVNASGGVEHITMPFNDELIEKFNNLLSGESTSSDFNGICITDRTMYLYTDYSFGLSSYMTLNLEYTVTDVSLNG